MAEEFEILIFDQIKKKTYFQNSTVFSESSSALNELADVKDQAKKYIFSFLFEIKLILKMDTIIEKKSSLHMQQIIKSVNSLL